MAVLTVLAAMACSPSRQNLSKSAAGLYDYICDTYGNAIISGQQESTWMGSDQYEFEYIYEKTGKYPAIRVLDYMGDDFEGVNRRAAEWHDRGASSRFAGTVAAIFAAVGANVWKRRFPTGTRH